MHFLVCRIKENGKEKDERWNVPYVCALQTFRDSRTGSVATLARNFSGTVNSDKLDEVRLAYVVSS